MRCRGGLWVPLQLEQRGKRRVGLDLWWVGSHAVLRREALGGVVMLIGCWNSSSPNKAELSADLTICSLRFAVRYQLGPSVFSPFVHIACPWPRAQGCDTRQRASFFLFVSPGCRSTVER